MEPRDKKQEEDAVTLGLSTGQALEKLRDQLSSLLEQHQREQWQNSFLYHGNRHSCVHWPGAALTLLVVVGLVCCHGSQPKGSGIELLNAAALLLLLVLNLCLGGRQERLKRNEMIWRLKAIITQLSYLSTCVGEVKWPSSLYPDLYTPSSPSWSLHWTYRDSQLVNLPVSLLVEGDIIALRPGQEAFASLRGIKDDEHIVLEPGDLFPPFSPPPSPRANEKRGPQSPQQHRLFRVVRTPVLNNLELALSRPVTVLDNERFTVQSVITKLVCPVVAFLLVNTIRFLLTAPSLTPRCYNFVQLQLMGVLPILPLLFPIMWVLVNAYGEARVLAEFSRVSPAGLQEMLRCVWRHLVAVLKGKSQTLCCTSSLLHTLGSVTFTPGARELFKQENHLTLYQLPSGEKTKEFTSHRLHYFTKRQPPISHLISLFVRDSSSNVQMLSHGSADLILEACTDFWDGTDIYPLSGSDKKVLDFYQRACLSGYCSAFAYKPMQVSLSSQLNGKCMELAPGPCLFSGLELPSTTPIKHNSCRNSWSSDEGIGEGVERDDCVQALSGQIFMGMVSSQFQARLDTVRLIDALVTACIRFVYFSMEDELRSKVFAEKMGLETGWNCHISLTPNGDGPCDGAPSSPSHGSLHEDLNQSRDEAEGPLLPEEEAHSDLASFQPTDSDVPSFLEDCNRAKLPRGIHQVRPHLKNIDNVPLLVPLFTDCTPEAMCEMITIMQENREVTCCLGSAGNFRNSRLFLQSDLIALDPLYPSQCLWETFGYATGGGFNGEVEGLSPLRLSGQLNSMGCSVTFHQGESVSMVKLIEQARHTTYGIRKCFLFLLQCQLSLVIIQFLACLAQLPPPMNTTDILWVSCFSCPLLVSLLGKPPDSTVMTVATGKNLDAIPKKTQNYFLGCFLLKFGLTMCAYLLAFGFSLQAVCLSSLSHCNLNSSDNTTASCNIFAKVSPSAPQWFFELSNGLLMTQKIMAGFLVLHTVISLSYVHRSQPLWKKSPFSNTWWCVTVPVLVSQIVQATVDYQLWCDKTTVLCFKLADIPLEAWLLVSVSLLLVVVVNEVVKLHEIVRVRYQKRQKLQFETKLGMNSPF
uniref:Transmembrane protein 94 n=1 Tax=Neolamprologus brichardi TaxID=32507 RepID=A0A3Q4IG62_NEOBR